jgi:hypothetical protein
MLREAKLTSGIGVRTAHSIQYTSTKRPLWNQLLTSVNSVKHWKKTEIAQCKGQAPYLARFEVK